MPDLPRKARFGAPVDDLPAIEEVAVSVFLNGRHFATAMTVADRLPALAVGLLVTEQVIRSPDELESVREDGPCVRVLTRDPYRVAVPRRGVISGCGGAAPGMVERRLPALPPGQPVPWRRVGAALDTVADAPPGLFSASLMDPDGAVTASDDLGLATAFARVVGAALTAGALRPGMIAAVSHRATAEIARAAVIAGIPVLATTGPVTGLATGLARRSGLCLCGGTGTGFVCSAHPERLDG